MADGYVVEAAGVTKRFRDSRGGALLTAVDCLDIRAVRGKMTALIGPDGAGKTTFHFQVSFLPERCPFMNSILFSMVSNSNLNYKFTLEENRLPDFHLLHNFSEWLSDLILPFSNKNPFIY